MTSRTIRSAAAIVAIVAMAAGLAAWPAVATAQSPVGPEVLAKDARFRTGLDAALGAKAKERWIAGLENSGPVIEVEVEGTRWLQASPCKPHDCAEHNLLVLYARSSGEVVGLLHDQPRHEAVGRVSPALASALEKLWKKEFRPS